MRHHQIRSETARRLAATRASLPSSLFGRQTRLVAGLGSAGARSLGRALGRRFGRGRADDLEPEIVAAATVGRNKGVTMKMGQLAGYLEVGLPEALRAALSALHTQAPPLPFDHVRRVVEAELGAAGRALLATLVPAPLSAASVGQVHRGALPDGTAVAVKVLHPGLDAIIARELAPARLASRLASWIYPRAQLSRLVDEVRARLVEECDYALEARRQARFAARFAGHPTIVVPAVHAALSSARVLTTTLVEGVHLDAWLAGAPDAARRDRAGAALFEFFLAPLWQDGLYDADPHPGNYLFLDDGRVAFVDFGCAAELDGERARAARELVRAFFAPLFGGGERPFDLGARPRVSQLLRGAWRDHAAALSGELAFLVRTFLGLSTVLGRIGARADWERLLHAPPHTARATHAAHAAPAPSLVTPSPQPQPPTAHPSPTAQAAPEAQAAPPSAPEAQAAEREPSPATPVEAPAPAADTGTYDLVLVHPGGNLIAVIRELRDATGLELRDVKALVDDAPTTIAPARSRADIDALRQRLESAGARVDLRRVVVKAG